MAALTEQSPTAGTTAAAGVGGRGWWMRSALIIVLLALLAGAAVLGLRNSSLLPANVMSGPSGRSGGSSPSHPFASPIAEKASGMVDSVKDALGAIAERSPGLREGAQLINKLARQRSFLARPGHPRGASSGRPHRASRSIPRRAPPAPTGPADSLLSDLVAPLEGVVPGQSAALVPAAVVPPAGGGGGFFAPAPGPVFLGGGGPGGSVTPPPGPVTPPVVETPTPSSPVPEPSTWLMLIVGLAVVAAAMRQTAGQTRRGEVTALLVA